MRFACSRFLSSHVHIFFLFETQLSVLVCTAWRTIVYLIYIHWSHSILSCFVSPQLPSLCSNDFGRSRSIDSMRNYVKNKIARANGQFSRWKWEKCTNLIDGLSIKCHFRNVDLPFIPYVVLFSLSLQKWFNLHSFFVPFGLCECGMRVISVLRQILILFGVRVSHTRILFVTKHWSNIKNI